MPVTFVGAIYATNSKLLQRIYIPHGDDREIDAQHVGYGERIIRVPLSTYQTGGPSAVQAVIGQPKISGRCHVVHHTTNEVIDTIMADPDLYKHPDGHKVISAD